MQYTYVLYYLYLSEFICHLFSSTRKLWPPKPRHRALVVFFTIQGHQRQQVWKSKMRSFIVFLLNSMCSPQKESNGNSFLEVSLITAGFPRQVYSGPFNPMGNNFGGRRFPTKKKSGDCHCHATNIYCQGCHCLLNQSKPRWNTTPTSGKVKQCQTFHKAGKLRRKIKCPYGPY